MPLGQEQGALRYRDDIRPIMIDLVRKNEPKKVAAIHRKAVGYYKERASVDDRAEELFHRLALGQATRTLDRHWFLGAEKRLQSSFDDLPLLSVPSVGSLGCSDIVGICLDFGNGESDPVVLTVGLEPELESCLQDGLGSEYQVVVEPAGTPLDYVTVSIGSQTQTLCSGCVAGPGISFDLADPVWALSVGDHDLKPRQASGRNYKQNLDEAVEAISRFIAEL